MQAGDSGEKKHEKEKHLPDTFSLESTPRTFDMVLKCLDNHSFPCLEKPLHPMSEKNTAFRAWKTTAFHENHSFPCRENHSTPCPENHGRPCLEDHRLRCLHNQALVVKKQQVKFGGNAVVCCTAPPPFQPSPWCRVVVLTCCNLGPGGCGGAVWGRRSSSGPSTYLLYNSALMLVGPKNGHR